MICVTGAGGTLGSEVVRQLASLQAPFRAAYCSSHKAEAAQADGFDAVVIDYERPETLTAAFQGCDRLFLLGLNAVDQTRLELNAVEAAKAGGVPHLVKRMLDLERYFREDQASLITSDIQQVTGRDPRRFVDYLSETTATDVWNRD